MKTSPLVFIFLLAHFTWAQVKIGDNIDTIDQSSLIELESLTKVLVVTRVSTTQMNTITPLNGALVYNTDENCLYQFRNDAWVSLCVDILGGQTVTTITENNDGTFSYNNEAGNTVSIAKASLIDNNDGTFTFDNGSLPLIQLDTNADSNPYNNVLSSLVAENVQDAIDELNTAINAALAADLDTDDTNELSDLELTSTTLSLTNPEAGAIGVDLDTTFATDAELLAATDDDITGVTFDGADLTVEEGSTTFSANLSALEESADIIAVQNDVDANEAAANSEITANATAINDEESRALAAELAIQNDIDANEAAASAAIALKEDAANKSTDITLADATNTLFPTELAVKTYVDGQIAATADDDITAVTFDGTDLTVEEGSTTFSANLSALEESADINAVQNDVDANEAAANSAITANATAINDEESRALAAELAIQNDVDANEAAAIAAIALKEDAANKSNDITLADATNTLFPTELAVKTYVDGQIAATADDDITGVTFDGTDLTVEEGSTTFSTNLSALEESADIIAVQNDVDANEVAANAAIAANATAINDEESRAIAAELAIQNDVDANEAAANSAIALKEDAANKSTDGTLAGNSNVNFPTEQAVKTYVDALSVTDFIDGNKIATITEADGTLIEIDESITTLASPTGAESTLVYTNEANGITTIPNIVRSVNGVNPAANGNVAVVLSSVSTGLESNLPLTGIDADVYIVSGEVAPNSDRNGVAFIYDDPSGWQEVTTDLSTADARYVNIIGDAMTGPLAMGNNGITEVNDPVNSQDAATKNYVDNQVATITTDDDISAVDFDGINLNITESGTTLSANLSALEESADITANTVLINTNITNINSNGTDITNLQNDKEASSNKSTDVTLADATNTLFPTEHAVKTYVDGQITATADDDITGVTFDGTDLTVEEDGTAFSANLSALEESADIVAVQNDVDANEAAAIAAIALKEDAANKSTDITLADATNTLFPTELAVKTYVDGQIAATGDGNITSSSLSVGGDTNALLGDVTLEITPGANDQVLTTDNLGALAWVNSSTLNHTGMTGSIFFSGAAGNPDENNSQLFWDSANNRLGIGTNSPTHKLQVGGQVRATSFANANGTSGSPSYRFNDDGNTGMYKAAADQLAFSTGGTEALRIDDSGKVGIGTPIPDESLHIANNMRLDGSFEDKDGDAGTIGQILTSTATGTDWTDAPSAPTETVTTLAQDIATGVITYTNETTATQTANVVAVETTNDISVGANGGAFYESPIKAFGKIASTGTITKSTAGITVTKLAGSGHYRITLPAGITSDADYIIQLTQPGRGGNGNDDPGISYNNQTITNFEVIIGDNDNGGTDRSRYDSEFMFTILDL